MVRTSTLTTQGTYAVEFEHVSKCYGEFIAVNDLTVKILRGSITAILGPNGAGKTTAINMMLGMTRPTTGTIRLLGTDPSLYSSREKIGAMLQTAGAPETLKVSELLQLWSSYYPKPLSYKELILAAGLEKVEKSAFGTLSGGQKQRVAFALALCSDPQILFLDEPTAGLDVETRRNFWEQIRQRAYAGCTVIFSTHYLEEANALAERIILMRNGRIIADASPEAIRQSVGKRLIQCKTTLAVERLRQLPFVETVQQDEHSTRLIVSTAEPAVRELLNLDHNLTSLEVNDLSLDDAFLHLTQERS